MVKLDKDLPQKIEKIIKQLTELKFERINVVIEVEEYFWRKYYKGSFR